MDPGSAFGTGSHPTTRLCLEAIEELSDERGGRLGSIRVADLGCGSGILGIAALLEGASSVVAADTDSLAVRATRDNAVVSGFREQFLVDLGSVERLAELLEGRPADLLLCNILAPVIEALCPAFDTVLAPGGLGFLSGLLESGPSPAGGPRGTGLECGTHRTAESVGLDDHQALLTKIHNSGLLHKSR